MEDELNEAIKDIVEIFDHLQRFHGRWGDRGGKLRARLSPEQQKRLDAVFEECEAKASFLTR